MLQRFGVSLPADLLERFDALIEKRGYTNRSEAIRDMIRDSLIEEEWRAGSEEVLGAAIIVYDHHVPDVARRLTTIQHDAHPLVVSTMHIHLDHHNCMEILALKGRAASVEALANKLISARGVKHGHLFRSTRGAGL